MTTIVIAHQSFPDTRLEEEALQAIDATVLVTDNLQTAQAREIALNADALMVTIQNVDGDFIRSLKDCKIIARVGTGLDAIDIPAATACGIWVTNVSDYSIDEVSTHAIALLLHHARRLTANARIRAIRELVRCRGNRTRTTVKGANLGHHRLRTHRPNSGGQSPRDSV